jgi:uncharacterized protein YndB with AHSA1/START domain
MVAAASRAFVPESTAFLSARRLTHPDRTERSELSRKVDGEPGLPDSLSFTTRHGSVTAGRASCSIMEFFGRYLEVTPYSRLVWTNDEGDGGKTITTVTFEETGGRTLLAVHDLYPSKEAFDGAIASGSISGMPEALAQLDELILGLGASAGES